MIKIDIEVKFQITIKNLFSHHVHNHIEDYIQSYVLILLHKYLSNIMEI